MVLEKLGKAPMSGAGAEQDRYSSYFDRNDPAAGNKTVNLGVPDFSGRASGAEQDRYGSHFSLVRAAVPSILFHPKLPSQMNDC